MSDNTQISDRELLELAAKAGAVVIQKRDPDPPPNGILWVNYRGVGLRAWNPFNNEGDLYRLAQKLKINIDYADECAWKRLPNGVLIQEFWGDEYGDEAHAIVRVAVEIGRANRNGSK